MDIKEIIGLFTEAQPAGYEIIETSRGENDFREAVIVRPDTGGLPPAPGDRIVIKLADNGFTDPERIAMWERLAEEYRRRGCYCPRFLRTKAGEFPWVEYKGRRCFAYGEEFARFRAASSFEAADISPEGMFTYLDDVLRLNGEIAAAHLELTDLPSAWILFGTFDPADREDEVMENARAWLARAGKLPDRFRPQVARIWERWQENRAFLAREYHRLPASVFQADLNCTNVLLDEEGRFAGIMDFNLAGREVFLNYLFREVPFIFGAREEKPVPEESGSWTDELLRRLIHGIEIVRESYAFCEAEKELALPLFRCLFPLWFTSVEQLKTAKGEKEIQAALDDTERAQTLEIDFRAYMIG